jgi:signal transduction histidine kinase
MESPHTARPADRAAPGEAPLRRLAAGLAHNVNNALTGVVGCLELALRHCPPGAEAHPHLQNGLACAYRAADAVRRIVAFAAHTASAEPAGPLSLRAVAEHAAEHLKAEARGVAVGVSGPAGWVRAREGLVRAALDPVLRNAVEAMPGGGELRLRVEEEAGRCRLRVEDTGSGVAPEVLPRLFEPFVTTKADGRLGLGLALCRQMVEQQGGAVEAASAAGRGTTVTLSFPALEPPALAWGDAASPVRLAV